MKRITIGIGELFASDQPVVISTVLGSCVSVCLYDPVKKVGGMNHIFLPGNADYLEFNASARYGINAMELLINSMLSLKAERRRLRAKVFGGGHVMERREKQAFSPGDANVEFSFRFLKEEKIPIDGYSVGGNCGRRIELHCQTGEVRQVRFQTGSLGKIARMEQSFGMAVRERVAKPGKVALFGKEDAPDAAESGLGPVGKTPLREKSFFARDQGPRT